MNDAEFLRHVAHTAEVDDPIDETEIKRMREIADRLERLGPHAEQLIQQWRAGHDDIGV